MSRYTTVLAVLILFGCSGQQKKATPVASAHKPVAQKKKQTMAEWIAEMNAKKEKCEQWEGGGGSNGYNSWSVSCVHGVRVYRDTTEEMQEAEAHENRHKNDLINAARSRVLTAKETKELLDYGPYIFVHDMQPFFQSEIEKSFDELLLQQARLKALGGERRHE